MMSEPPILTSSQKKELGIPDREVTDSWWDWSRDCAVYRMSDEMITVPSHRLREIMPNPLVEAIAEMGLLLHEAEKRRNHA